MSCVHFTGLYGPGMKKHDECRAGVKYNAVKGTKTGGGVALPCLNHDGTHCARQRFRTAEEEARSAEIAASIGFTFEARARILKATGGKRGVQGWVACPKCGRRLGYTVAGFNGHIWGNCETAECLSWME